MKKAKRNQFHPDSWIHPSETLSEKLSEMGMDAKAFSEKSGLPENLVSAFLRSECPVSPEMAAAFEKVTNIPISYWLRCQREYDEAETRKSRNALPFFRRIAAAF